MIEAAGDVPATTYKKFEDKEEIATRENINRKRAKNEKTVIGELVRRNIPIERDNISEITIYNYLENTAEREVS